MTKRRDRSLSAAALPANVQRRRSKNAIALGIFAGAGIAAALAAWASAVVIEDRSAEAVKSKLLESGITWANVEADGLQLRLLGTAPNEAARFRVVNMAGAQIDSARIRDELEVTPVTAVEPPKFALEMLRNDDGIQLIGLLPQGDASDKLKSEADALDQDGVSDMIETAAYDAPAQWQPAFDFGVEALKTLPRAKISVSEGRVVITAIAESEAEQRRLTADLNRARPENVSVRVDISAPRPVLTPFPMRFVLDDKGARFDACAADTERARIRILAAGTSAGVTGKVNCTIGLGVPSPSWADAAILTIAAAHTLGAATVTFADADISLEAASSVSQASFDRVVGELQNALPQVFSLNATLEKPEIARIAGPSEFTAEMDEAGRVELRGRLTDAVLRNAVDGYARARFGSTKVLIATRMDPELPDGWPVRVLAGLEAMKEVAHGKLVVRPDTVEIEGVTGNPMGQSRISQILSSKLGQGQTYKVAVRYDKELDPMAALPTPEECHDEATAVLAKRKIVFSPGSAEIDGPSSAVMDSLAKALKNCGHVKMEIGGHTDAQGSEEGNRALSQARAEAVLVALQGRGVAVEAMIAKGYGEDEPIADNGTEAGRDENRRITFTLRERPAQPTPAAASEGAAGGAADAVGGGAASDGATGAVTDPASGDTAAPPSDPTAAELPASETEAEASPDLADDDSPSVAPTEKTRRPVARPARRG